MKINRIRLFSVLFLLASMLMVHAQGTAFSAAKLGCPPSSRSTAISMRCANVAASNFVPDTRGNFHKAAADGEFIPTSVLN